MYISSFSMVRIQTVELRDRERGGVAQSKNIRRKQRNETKDKIYQSPFH